MKYLASVAMLLGMLALPALGQQGVARGGFGGHAGAAPHGFSAPAPHSFSRGFSGGFAAHGPVGMRPGGFGARGPVGLRPGGFGAHGPVGLRPGGPRLGQGLGQRPGMMRFSGSRFAGSRGPMNTPYRRFATGADHGRGSGNWPHDRDRDRDRDHDRHHRMIYWNGGVYPYGYFYSGYPIYTGDVDPWLFGPDDYDQGQPAGDYGNYGSAGNDGSAGNGGGDGSGYPQSPYAPDPGYAGQYGMEQPASPQGRPSAARQPDSARQPYTGSAPAKGQGDQQPQVSSGGLSSPEVTVIYKDGRPAEKFQNYLLTADTLTVYEPHYRQIPLAQVNLAATEAANQADGVDFRVPRR